MSVLKKIWRFLRPEAIPSFLAGFYDKIHGSATPEIYKRFVEDMAQEVERGRILDVGTGPGYVSIEIARRIPGVFIDGIDLSEGMIRMAQFHAKKAGLEKRLHFEVGDGCSIRFPNESYDIVICVGSLHHWRDPLRVFNEIFRVLKQGGEVWIHDTLADAADEDIDECHCLYRKMQPSLFMRVLIGVLFPKSGIRFGAYSKGELEEIIKSTKFETYEFKKDGVFIIIKLKKI